MAFAYADQQELFLPLIEGVYEDPPWSTFMRNLVARTYARRAFLIIAPANAAATQEPTIIHVSAPRAVAEPPLDVYRIAALNLHPYGALRPGRVYAIDEVLSFDDPAMLQFQRDSLNDMGIRFGRWLRITAGGAGEAWILLVREREDLSSAAVATLAAIGPHLSAALRVFEAISQQRLLSAMSQRALGKLGVGQIALDESGRVMAADGLAESLLTFVETPDGRVGRRLQLAPAAQSAFERACQPESRGPAGSTRLVEIDPARGLVLALQDSDLVLPQASARPALIGTLRIAVREDERAGARLLQALHGLSQREASLAELLSRGSTISEAGRALRLTDETARNYSKKVYAKTAARGQPDLVRRILTGLAPLA